MQQVEACFHDSCLIRLVLMSVSCAWITGCFRSSTARESVVASVTAPQIVTQPANQFAQVGDSALFTVSATGTMPRNYDWRRNGASLNAAGSASYATPAVAAADDGAIYTVVVSNSAGSVVSLPARLTVSLRSSHTPAAPEHLRSGGE